MQPCALMGRQSIFARYFYNMKISYNWLNQFLTLDTDLDQVTTLLTDLGLEVGGTAPYQSVRGGLEGIVVGHVITCEKHPDADRLKVTQVDIGEVDPLRIVCGAHNVAAGQKVPVATVGTTLYTPEGEAWKIKKSKIRGQVSEGMICAEDEMGIGTSHDGIMVLDAAWEPGTQMTEVVDVVNDTVIDIDLTPNRSDAMSHWGVARDLRSGMLQNGEESALITPSTTSFHVENRTNRIPINVHDKVAAPRYCGVVLTDLEVKESPDWIKHRLQAIGIKPKNNVVDVTNYVMHELGQPLHAFDLDKVGGREINVRLATAGEKFTTLDGVERELNEEDLVIADAKKPMCLAGIYGGENSGVSENTTSIFLESAYFNPVTIRKSAKRHGLSTDASFRYERGIDPNITDYALRRAVLLIQELAGGLITSDLEDLYPEKIKDTQVLITFDQINKLIGTEIPREDIKNILTSLDIQINNVTESGLGLTIPAYRNDVTRPADVIEEILRIYGYNNVPTPTKTLSTTASESRYASHKLEQIAADVLLPHGYHEAMNNSLTKASYAGLPGELDNSHRVQMLNPLSQDLSFMRTNLVYGLLESMAHNLNRRVRDIKLFEFGKRYEVRNEQRIESKQLVLAATGAQQRPSWNAVAGQSDFYVMKGIVTQLLSRFTGQGLREVPTEHDMLDDCLELGFGKSKVAWIGTVKQNLLNAFGCDQPIVMAVIDWEVLRTAASRHKMVVQAIPTMPSSTRDFAMLVDDKVTFKQLRQVALDTIKKNLVDISLADVYTGKGVPAGKKSYALSYTFQDAEKTLTDKQLDGFMSKLLRQYESKFDAKLR